MIDQGNDPEKPEELVVSYLDANSIEAGSIRGTMENFVSLRYAMEALSTLSDDLSMGRGEEAAEKLRNIINGSTDWYQFEADMVDSKLFAPQNVGVTEYIDALQAVIDASERMDQYKKVLFRGRSRETMGLPPLADLSVTLADVFDPQDADLLHGITGVITEAGELAFAAAQACSNTGKDITNIIEESGDLLWYINRLLRWSRVSFPYAMRKNIDKLTGRFGGNKYNKENDANRNLAEERKGLEA